MRGAALGGLCYDMVAHITTTHALAVLLVGQVACSAISQAQRTEASDSLARARWEIVLRNRAFVIPERVVQGLPIQPTLGVWFRPTARVLIGADAQTVDNSGPGIQGDYLVSRTVPGGGSGNFLQEITYAARVSTATPRSHNGFAIEATWSRGVRSYFAMERTTGDTVWGNRRREVPMLEGSFSHHRAGGAGAIGAAIAWLARDDAMYLRALPGETRHFGTLTGVSANGSLQLTEQLQGFARLFVPVTGNNTIHRSDGRPAQTLVYDAGVRLILSPSATGELFLSNALGNTGALSVIADREYRAIGVGLRAYPDAGRQRDDGALVRDTARGAPIVAPSVSGVWLARGDASVRVRRSAQGLLAAAEWTPVRGVQGGVFLDLLDGVRDEGELGGLVRVGVLTSRSAGLPNAAVVAAASRTNNPLVNLLAGSWEEIHRLGLPKGGFRFGDESGVEGRLYVIALALPLEWYSGPTTVRLVPTVGYVQRNGVQLSGASLGVQRQLSEHFAAGADVGVVLGKGNTLMRDGRRHATPFGAIAEWHSGGAHAQSKFPLAVELFLTNRAGDSPFHSLRVRADRAVSGGLGVRIGVR